MSPVNCLLFIDDTPINEDLKKYFAQFDITTVQQKQLHSNYIESNTLVAILIHWSFLKNNPEVIHQFHTNHPVPLIIVNDRADEDICIKVLEAGADNFMIKPLYPRELHARINAIKKRILQTQQKIGYDKGVLAFTKWRLYPASRQVLNKNNQELSLSAREYDLLYTFVREPQRVLTREFLLQTNKKSELNPFDRRIDVQISRLRQKIEADARKPLLIKTIRNRGYMFTAPVINIKENDAY